MEKLALKRKNILIVAACVCLGIGVFALSISREGAGQDTSSASANQPNHKDDLTEKLLVDLQKDPEHSTAPNPDSSQHNLPHGIPLTRDGLGLDSDPFVATSEAEQK